MCEKLAQAGGWCAGIHTYMCGQCPWAPPHPPLRLGLCSVRGVALPPHTGAWTVPTPVLGGGGRGAVGGGGRLAQSPEACSRCGALHRLAMAVGRREATAIMDGSQRGGGGGGARPADREGGPRL